MIGEDRSHSGVAKIRSSNGHPHPYPQNKEMKYIRFVTESLLNLCFSEVSTPSFENADHRHRLFLFSPSHSCQLYDRALK